MNNYKFKLYTLNINLDLQESSSKKQVEQAIQNHILEKVELTGKYSR